MKHTYMLAILLIGNTVQCDDNQNNQKKSCSSKEDCADLNNSCQCYCSRKCGFRKKILEGPDKDEPVYVENDPNKKYCYCKQADLDTFNKQECAAKDQSSEMEIKETSAKPNVMR